MVRAYLTATPKASTPTAINATNKILMSLKIFKNSKILKFENVKIGTFQFVMKWFERDAHLYKPSDVGKNKFYVLKISSNNMIDDVCFFDLIISRTFFYKFINFSTILRNSLRNFEIFKRDSVSETIFIPLFFKSRVFMDLNLRIKFEHPITCQLMIITWWKSASTV